MNEVSGVSDGSAKDPRVAGPNFDGSHSMAKESRVGLAVAFVGTILANGALEWLTKLDTESWAGRGAQIGVAAVAFAVAALTAYLKKNR